MRVLLPFAALILSGPALALDPLPGERPSTDRDASTNFNRLGAKTLATDRLTIRNPGSTGDVSAMSVTPSGAGPAALSNLLQFTPRIGAGGTVALLNGPPLGTYQNSLWTATADSVKTTLGAILPGRYHAKAFADPATGLPCIWTLSGDAGPCVQAAIDAAAAAGGGDVIIDGGAYGLATGLLIGTSGVKLRGLGVGDMRSNAGPGVFQAQTRFVWTGAAGGTMLAVQPSGMTSLRSTDVDNIVFDGANTAGVCAKFVSVNYSTLRVGGAECRQVNIWTTTAVIGDSPGMQKNDIWFYSRSTGAAYAATGIFLDGNSDRCAFTPTVTCWNTSYNRIHDLSAWHGRGDGIVLGDMDNNMIEDVTAYPEPNASPRGRPVVLAAAGYTMPNGMKVSGAAYTNNIRHTSSVIDVQGLTAASTVTPGGSNAGSASLAAVTRSLSAQTASGSFAHTFGSTAGVAAGMTASCGGTESGVLPGDTVVSVAGQTVTLAGPALGPVASGTSCTFGYGFNHSARKGTYTLTATSSTAFSLTAPAGGTSQTGIAPAGGVLTFTDLVVPLTGTAVAGDTWTFSVGDPAFQNAFDFVDKANSGPNPRFAPGASGWVRTSTNPFPLTPLWQGAYIPSGRGLGSATGMRSFATGEGSNASGSDSIAMGSCQANAPLAICLGSGSTAGGFGGMAFGHNTVSTGVYSTAMGEVLSATGYYSSVRGGFATDRGDSANVYANGQFAAQGDAQVRSQVARATVNSTTATRLTVDGGAANPFNGLRIPAGSAFGTVVDQVVCRETVTQGNWAKWRRKEGLLLRVGTGAPTYSGDASASTAPDQTGSTVAGAALQIAADTTNNVLAVSVTWPNANLVRCAADVRSLEAQ